MLRRFILLLLLAAVPAAAQVAVAPAPEPMLQFSDANGVPLAGGCVFSYAAGTSTPLATYAEFTGTTPNTNPVVLDAAGRAAIFLTGAAYKLELRAAGGVNCATGTTVWSIDGVSTFVPGDITKSPLTFSNAQTATINVQQAGGTARALQLVGHAPSAATGGQVNITSGSGSSTSGSMTFATAPAAASSGTFILKTGAVGSSFGAQITLNPATTTNGGSLVLTGGAANPSGNAGGGIQFVGGASGSGDIGGSIHFTSGVGGDTAAGGSVNFTAGQGGTTNGAGGPVNFTAGASQGSGNAGDITFTAGNAPGAGDGGDINFVPGTSASGTPGTVKLNGNVLGTKQVWRAGVVEAAPTVTEIATALPAPAQCTAGQTVDKVSVTFLTQGTGTLTFNVIRYNAAGVSQGNVFGSTQTYDNTGTIRQDYTVSTTALAATDYFRFNILTVNSQAAGTLIVEGRCNTVS